MDLSLAKRVLVLARTLTVTSVFPDSSFRWTVAACIGTGIRDATPFGLAALGTALADPAAVARRAVVNAHAERRWDTLKAGRALAIHADALGVVAPAGPGHAHGGERRCAETAGMTGASAIDSAVTSDRGVLHSWDGRAHNRAIVAAARSGILCPQSAIGCCIAAVPAGA